MTTWFNLKLHTFVVTLTQNKSLKILCNDFSLKCYLNKRAKKFFTLLKLFLKVFKIAFNFKINHGLCIKDLYLI